MSEHPVNSQECENPKREMCLSEASLTIETSCHAENTTSGKVCQTEGPWNIIIVNQIPPYLYDNFNETFMSVFSQYGTIESSYLHNTLGDGRFAVVTFSKEEDAWKVLEASQKKLIKYKNHVLMITLASDNYSPIQNLPDICLREIFQHVDSIENKFNVELVCKRWRDNGRCCWSNITRCQANDWEFNTFQVILSRVKNSLEYLYFFSGTENAPELLRIAAEHCVSLKELECDFREEEYSQCSLSMHTILQKNTNLRRLKVQINSRGNFNLDFMEVLPTELVEISIHTSIRHFTSASVALSRFENLRNLLLSGVIITNPHQPLDNVVNLERLALVDCRIPESFISTILRNNEGLKYLDIGLDDLTDASLKYIHQLPKLQVLVIESVMFADRHLREMPRLKGLMCQSPLITDEGIRNFFNSAADIKQLFLAKCSITLESIVIAWEWAKRTGKCLNVYVGANLCTQYLASKWKDTENFEVHCTYDDYYGIHHDMAGTLLLPHLVE